MTTETLRLKIPYPSDGQDPYYPAFQAMVKSLDAITFSDISERNTLFYGGGDVVWSLTSTLTFNESIVFVEPTYGQIQTLDPVADLSIPPGHFLYTEVSRGNTGRVVLGAEVASAIPVNVNATILAWHNPADNSLVWRSGARQIQGQAIGGVGNSGANSGAEYILSRLDPQLPNSKLLATGNGIVHSDSGPQGVFSLGLQQANPNPGRYEFATIEVDRFGRVTFAESTDPGAVNQRQIDVPIEPASTNLTIVKIGQGFDNPTTVPWTITYTFDDGLGNQDKATALVWRSAQVTGLAFYEVGMRYPLSVPLDAASYGDDSGVILKACLYGQGVEIDGSVRFVIDIDGDVHQVTKVGFADGRRYQITLADLPNLGAPRPGARGVITVIYGNQSNPNKRYRVGFGGVDVAFVNYVRP